MIGSSFFISGGGVLGTGDGISDGLGASVATNGVGSGFGDVFSMSLQATRPTLAVRRAIALRVMNEVRMGFGLLSMRR
jgi:hypothetical protein